MAYKKTYKKKTYKKKAVAPKPRGWHASADLGTFGKYSVGYAKRSLTAAVKNIVDGDKECKRKLISSTTVSLLHNAHFNRNILGNIAQGTSTLQRESEEIHLCAFKGTLSIYNQYTAGNWPTCVRLMLVRMKIETGAATDAYVSTLGVNDLYLNNTSSTTLVESMVDPKKAQILWEKRLVLPTKNGLTTSTINNTVTFVDFNVPLGIDYVYKTASNYGNKYNLYWVMTSFSAGASSGTTFLASVEETSQLIYKDK